MRTSGLRERLDSFLHGGERVAVERFGPAGGGRHPAVVLLHGRDGLERGGLRYRTLARTLAGQGFAVFLVDYFGRVAPLRDATDPVQFLGWVERVGAAVRHAASQPDIDGERIGLVGVSLGGYLAVTAARDARVKAVVVCGGGIPEVVARDLQRLPPVLIIHGEADAVVPVREARRLGDLLAAKGLPHEQVLYPREGHVLGPAASLDAMIRTVAFLQKHLALGQTG